MFKATLRGTLGAYHFVPKIPKTSWIIDEL